MASINSLGGASQAAQLLSTSSQLKSVSSATNLNAPRTQQVSSPTDNAVAFFSSKALSQRATQLNDTFSALSTARNAVGSAQDAVSSVSSIVDQAKGFATQAKDASEEDRAALAGQYANVISQIDSTVQNASYQGKNLANGDSIEVSTDRSQSSFTITGTKNDVDSLKLSRTADFSSSESIDATISQLDAASSQLRANGQELSKNSNIIQTRIDFTQSYDSAQKDSANKLTLKDLNDEGANLVSLQTRQQLIIQSLSLSGQQQQSILSLFR